MVCCRLLVVLAAVLPTASASRRKVKQQRQLVLTESTGSQTSNRAVESVDVGVVEVHGFSAQFPINAVSEANLQGAMASYPFLLVPPSSVTLEGDVLTLAYAYAEAGATEEDVCKAAAWWRSWAGSQVQFSSIQALGPMQNGARSEIDCGATPSAASHGVFISMTESQASDSAAETVEVGVVEVHDFSAQFPIDEVSVANLKGAMASYPFLLMPPTSVTLEGDVLTLAYTEAGATEEDVCKAAAWWRSTAGSQIQFSSVGARSEIDCGATPSAASHGVFISMTESQASDRGAETVEVGVVEVYGFSAQFPINEVSVANLKGAMASYPFLLMPPTSVTLEGDVLTLAYAEAGATEEDVCKAAAWWRSTAGSQIQFSSVGARSEIDCGATPSAASHQLSALVASSATVTLGGRAS